MEITEAIKRIKAMPMFKDLQLDKPSESSQFGTIPMPHRHFRDGQKNELKLDNYRLFLAQMYKDSDTMDEFFYLSLYRSGKQRDFRRRSFYGVEYNKVFVTGKTIDILISNLEEDLVDFKLK